MALSIGAALLAAIAAHRWWTALIFGIAAALATRLGFLWYLELAGAHQSQMVVAEALVRTAITAAVVSPIAFVWARAHRLARNDKDQAEPTSKPGSWRSSWKATPLFNTRLSSRAWAGIGIGISVLLALWAFTPGERDRWAKKDGAVACQDAGEIEDIQSSGSTSSRRFTIEDLVTSKKCVPLLANARVRIEGIGDDGSKVRVVLGTNGHSMWMQLADLKSNSPTWLTTPWLWKDQKSSQPLPTDGSAPRFNADGRCIDWNHALTHRYMDECWTREPPDSPTPADERAPNLPDAVSKFYIPSEPKGVGPAEAVARVPAPTEDPAPRFNAPLNRFEKYRDAAAPSVAPSPLFEGEERPVGLQPNADGRCAEWNHALRHSYMDECLRREPADSRPAVPVVGEKEPNFFDQFDEPGEAPTPSVAPSFAGEEREAQTFERTESNFVPIKLPRGIELQMPRGWWVLGSKVLQLIDTSVEAAMDLSEVHLLASEQKVTLFAANSMPPSTYAAIRINSTTPPSITGRALQASFDAGTVKEEMRLFMEQSLPLQGNRLVEIVDARIDEISGFPALVLEYRRTGPKGNVRVQMNRIVTNGQEISVNLSYRESEQAIWKPVIAKIRQSISVAQWP